MLAGAAAKILYLALGTGAAAVSTTPFSERRSAGLQACPRGGPDQPPPRLRRSAVTSAKAEGPHYTRVKKVLPAAVSTTGSSVSNQKGAVMTKHGSGTFDVKITPQKDEGVGDASVGRMAIDKQYHGDLEGTGLGQMLTGMSADVKDSGAYVAIERVRGTLHGRSGSFIVHHRGIMTRGAQDLTITVVPDSGTEELKGIAGTMTIDIKEGKHFYGIDYTLP
jgi:hypothetical protein